MKKILLTLAVACAGITVNSYAQTIVGQDFETAMAPWTVATTGSGGGWQIVSTSTPLQLGTIAAHTKYAVVNEDLLATSTSNDPTRIVSPVFSLSGAAHPYLSYDWAYFEAHLSASPYTAEQSWIEISIDGGTTFTLLDSIMYSGSGDGSWDTKFISLSSYTSATCVLRFCYSDNGTALVGMALDNINVFNAQANDIDLLEIAPLSGDPLYDFILSGSTATFGGIIRNLSPTTITTFSASYQVAATTPVTATYTGLSIAPMATYTFTCTTPYTDAVLGSQPVQMWVTETGDPVLTNDSMNTAINAYSFAPTKNFMFEEGTGMWCGYCVRGIVYMDSLVKLDSAHVNVVAVHDQLNGTDALAAENTLTSDYDKFVSHFPGFTGYPGVLLDRRYVIDPSEAPDAYTELNGTFGFADMSCTMTLGTDGQINVSTNVKPALNLSGDYRVALVISEDNVHNNSYYQHNYYSYADPGGSAGALSGCGFNFTDSVFSLPGSSLYFRFVARYSIPDMNTTQGGVASSLPATLTSGTSYPYSFSAVTMPSDWNPRYLRAMVMLIDNNPNSNTYLQVLNSAGAASPALGVSDVTAGIEGLNIFPNPAKNDAHAFFDLAQTGTVQFAIYDAIGREVFTVPAEEMKAGGQQINFSTANLPAGVYHVSITTASGTVTQGLSVVR